VKIFGSKFKDKEGKDRFVSEIEITIRK